jgi:hypothetical protein
MVNIGDYPTMKHINLKKSVRTFLIAGLLGVVIGLSLEFISPIIFFNKREIDACKKFIKQSQKVEELFGNIEGIRLLSGSRNINWSSRSGTQTNGVYNFRIHGTSKSGFLKISWQYNGQVPEVTQVSIPVGLFRAQVLTPGSQYDLSSMFASTRIWNGIVSVLFAGLLFLMAYVFTEKSNGSVNISSKGKIKKIGKWLFLISGFSALTKSVLCFAGLSLLL